MDELDDVPDFGRLLREATDDAAPYTQEARARVAFAVRARELAEVVIRLVRVDDTTRADLVAQVQTVVESSQKLLTQAVVAARANPTQSWEKIGSALEMSRQSANARFGDACDAWSAAYNGHDGAVLPEGADDPAAAAAELDQWLLHHLDDTAYRGAHPDRPVSGALARMNPDEEVSDIARRENLLWQHHVSPPLEQLAALAEREAVLQDVMADIGLGSGGRQIAARCRAMAAGYRAQAANAEPHEGDQ